MAMIDCVCGTEMTWLGDHSDDEDEEWGMESQFSCPKCKRGVMLYTPREPTNENSSSD